MTKRAQEILRVPASGPIVELSVESNAGVPLSVRLMNLAAIIIPFVGVVSVPFFVWGWGFNWVDLILLLVMYVITVLGITVGFHRLFTHRSFETNVAVKF